MKKHKLLENTIMLYVLVFSNYIFGFLTVPYQTRILGPEIFGKIGFAVAFTTYFRLVFDFGFILSATEEVSENRDDNDKLAKILTSVTVLKLLFIVFSFLILLFIIFNFKIFSDFKLLYIFYFLYVAIDSLQPDYLYRGLENMKIITIRNVIIKAFFTLCIFVFLKRKDQYLLVPIFTLLGSLISLIFVFYHIFKKIGIKFVRIESSDLLYEYNQSKIFFLSRIASTIYGATNTFILGIIYPYGNTLGYYTSSDKLLTAGKSACSPIADSVYPYMVKNKNFKIIKKILFTLMPIIGLICIACFVFSKEICLFLFGDDFAGSAVVLRYMLPILFIILPSYMLGFPTMTPLGLKREANFSVIIGSVYHLFMIIVLYIFNALNLQSLCILTITTELFILLLRIYYIVKKRRKK